MSLFHAIPSRRQAITWPNPDPVHLRICASLGAESRLTHIGERFGVSTARTVCRRLRSATPHCSGFFPVFLDERWRITDNVPLWFSTQKCSATQASMMSFSVPFSPHSLNTLTHLNRFNVKSRWYLEDMTKKTLTSPQCVMVIFYVNNLIYYLNRAVNGRWNLSKVLANIHYIIYIFQQHLFNNYAFWAHFNTEVLKRCWKSLMRLKKNLLCSKVGE